MSCREANTMRYSYIPSFRIPSLLLVPVAASPSWVYAQNGAIGATPNTVGDLYALAINLMQLAVPILIGLALVVFLWGIVTYIASGGNESARSAAGAYILWGIIGLFVMISVWGLVLILSNTFGFPFGLPLAPLSTGGSFPTR